MELLNGRGYGWVGKIGRLCEIGVSGATAMRPVGTGDVSRVRGGGGGAGSTASFLRLSAAGGGVQERPPVSRLPPLPRETPSPLNNPFTCKVIKV